MENEWFDIETSKGTVRVKATGVDELTSSAMVLVDYGDFHGREGGERYALNVHGERRGYQHVTILDRGEYRFEYGTNWPTLSRGSRDTIESAICEAVDVFVILHQDHIDERVSGAREGSAKSLNEQAELLREMADEIDTQANRAREGLTWFNRPFDTGAKSKNGTTLRGFTMPSDYDIGKQIDYVREYEYLVLANGATTTAKVGE